MQPENKVWRVIADYEMGSICIIDEHGNLLMERNNLSIDAIKAIERNFLDKLGEDMESDKPCIAENSMYI
jgi:hypothetical protein